MSAGLEAFAQRLADKTRHHPMVIHLNPIGLFRLGHNNRTRLAAFDAFLSCVEASGGQLFIPTYSYSYTANKPYDVLHTRSSLDAVSEYVRQQHAPQRTYDPLFSYVQFGDFLAHKHYTIRDHNSFGAGSLLEAVFEADGYIGSLGHTLGFWTEVHYIEHQLRMPYRQDKCFSGTTKMPDNNPVPSQTTFYCRDHSFNLGVDLSRMAKDLMREGKIYIWKNEGVDFQFEVIKFKALFQFLQGKLQADPMYLCIGRDQIRSY